jgi:phosphoribosylaminoimidazole-succinocarboxamide synthase
MISEDKIKQQIKYALEKTNFILGDKYQGKVRDNYSKGNRMIMITTDRISAFDHVLGTIPFKGQILNKMAVFWFDQTKDIVKNHIIDVPDPNVMVVEKCKGIPVEMVIRGYITGSLWRDYESGKRDMYGIRFKDGLKKDQKFPEPIITPSTKEEYGKHDMPISNKEIIARKLLTPEQLDKIEKIAVKLFKRGTEIAAKNGLILVDTKYEFGFDEKDNIVLMDEIHTPDSSRYWIKETYEELFREGKEQQILDKEHIRNWLRSQGFSGEGVPPKLSNEIKVELAIKYMKVYETITGELFIAETGDVLKRITKNLKDHSYLN